MVLYVEHSLSEVFVIRGRGGLIGLLGNCLVVYTLDGMALMRSTPLFCCRVLSSDGPKLSASYPFLEHAKPSNPRTRILKPKPQTLKRKLGILL